MLIKRRVDGSFAGIDLFYRNHAVGLSEDEVISKVKSKKCFVDSYEHYYEYIQSLDCFHTVYYNITYRCELSCPYCYAPKNAMFVDKETNKCIAQKLAELNTKEIVLIGGEPFNHPFLGEIVDELIRSGLRSISILTNGTILNDSHCRMISDYGIELQISLDGASEETNAPTRGSGNFTKVVTNIERLRSIGASYSVMKTLTADNICNAKDFVDYCETHSIDYGFFVAKKVNDDLRPRQGSLFDLCVYLEKIGYDVFDALTCVKISEQMMFSQPGFPVTHCGAGISSLVVNPNADVFPCLKMLDDEDKFICNLMDDNSTELIRAYRKVLLKSDLVDNLPTCRDCNIKYICGGGCRADRAFTAKNRHHYSQCATQRQSVDYFLEVLKNE